MGRIAITGRRDRCLFRRQRLLREAVGKGAVFQLEPAQGVYSVKRGNARARPGVLRVGKVV